MNGLLNQLARNGEISWLSFYFAEFIAQQGGVDVDHPLGLSAALICEANRNGDVCINLAQLSNQPYFSSELIEAPQMPNTGKTRDWCKQLLASECVGAPDAATPLTLEANRLYLNRFWHYENSVAEKILALLNRNDAGDKAQIQSLLEKQFTDPTATDSDQQAAVLTAVSQRFSVISGGPGSGKTSSIIRILAVLLGLNPRARIALAAPTGKAAARMMDSIRLRIDDAVIDQQTRSALPIEATTIHRLLEYRWHRYGYHAQRQLAVDCVVIDEASMIDLSLMFHLLAALPQQARLILLGDRDQLASVAAGNVLGDITGHGLDPAASGSPIATSIALLRRNYRFNQDSAIGELAGQVNQGNIETALALLSNRDRGINWVDSDAEEIDSRVLAELLDAYQAVAGAESPDAALGAFASTRLLCATNHGPLGVDALNRQISNALMEPNNRLTADLYHGLPIMIVRNRHNLGLFNGDTGILWQIDRRLMACFTKADGGIRSLALNRLPEFVPAWASTVHKSQGSEFDSVYLILPPDPDSEVLSRELLYTAITRARHHFILHGSRAVLLRSIEQLTLRYSGLAEKLGWNSKSPR